MNPNNYASLEASQRLVEAGVMLETDAVWIADEYPPFGASMKIILKWDIRNKKELIFANFGKLPNGTVPAPSMAEVWRELPATIPDRGLYAPMKLRKAGDGKTWVSYFRVGSQIIDSIKADTNPTDALINLLIWVRKENNAS